MGKLPNVFTSKLPWAEAKHPIWPITQLLLRRNIHSYPFPSKLSSKQAKEVLETLKKPYDALHFLHSLNPHEKELLFEHFILHEGFEKKDREEGFIVNDTGNFLGLINLEDHLHLRMISFETHLNSAWEALSQMEQSASKDLSFAFSPKFGYLTSDPTVCGTGLSAQAFLHIPTLLHLEKFNDLRETFPDEISVKGLGKEGEYIADFILIENTYTLGVSEENILKLVEETAEKCVEYETSLRKAFDRDHAPLLKDKMARAFGLLSSACSLQIQETLSALSLIHLGQELGWIQKESSFRFFDLFFSSRRAHLSEQAHNENLTNDLLPSARASYLRKTIASLDVNQLFI